MISTQHLFYEISELNKNRLKIAGKAAVAGGIGVLLYKNGKEVDPDTTPTSLPNKGPSYYDKLRSATNQVKSDSKLSYDKLKNMGSKTKQYILSKYDEYNQPNKSNSLNPRSKNILDPTKKFSHSWEDNHINKTALQKLKNSLKPWYMKQ